MAIAALIPFALPLVWVFTGWLWHTGRLSTPATVAIGVGSVPVTMLLFALAAGLAWPTVVAAVLLSALPALLLYRPFVIFLGPRND